MKFKEFITNCPYKNIMVIENTLASYFQQESLILENNIIFNEFIDAISNKIKDVGQHVAKNIYQGVDDELGNFVFRGVRGTRTVDPNIGKQEIKQAIGNFKNIWNPQQQNQSATQQTRNTNNQSKPITPNTIKETLHQYLSKEESSLHPEALRILKNEADKLESGNFAQNIIKLIENAKNIVTKVVSFFIKVLETIYKVPVPLTSGLIKQAIVKLEDIIRIISDITRPVTFWVKFIFSPRTYEISPSKHVPDYKDLDIVSQIIYHPTSPRMAEIQSIKGSYLTNIIVRFLIAMLAMKAVASILSVQSSFAIFVLAPYLIVFAWKFIKGVAKGLVNSITSAFQ